MKWLLDGPLAAFDCETTGVSVEQDRIVTACVALLQPAAPTWKQEVHSWLIAPDIDIPQAATDIHGITTVFAKENGEPPAGALDVIAHDLARAFLAHIPVVGMNVVFDFTLLDRELRRHGLPTLDERLGRPIRPVVDVLVLDKFLDPFRKGSRRLETLCEMWGVRIDGAHNSTFDALAAARIAYKMALFSQDVPAAEARLNYLGATPRRVGEVADRLSTLALMSADKLHANQIRWRAEQCDSLRAHFDRNGTPHDGVPGDWPVLPCQRPVAEPSFEDIWGTPDPTTAVADHG